MGSRGDKGHNHKIRELIDACAWDGPVESAGAARALRQDVAELHRQLDALHDPRIRDAAHEQLTDFLQLAEVFVEHWSGDILSDTGFDEVAQEYTAHLTGLDERRQELLDHFPTENTSQPPPPVPPAPQPWQHAVATGASPTTKKARLPLILTAALMAIIAAGVGTAFRGGGNHPVSAATPAPTSASTPDVPSSTVDTPASSDASASTTEAPASTAVAPTEAKPAPTKSSTTTSASPRQPPTTGKTAASATTAASGAATAVTVTLTSDPNGNSVTAHIHVVTAGTGAVTLHVTAAGSDVYGKPGSTRPESSSFSLSGARAYDRDVLIDAIPRCHTTAYIGVTAVADAVTGFGFTTAPC